MNNHADSPECPPGRDIGSSEYLKPMKMSFDNMIQGCKFCIFNLYHNIWDVTASIAYLKSINIQQKFFKSFIIDATIKYRAMGMTISDIYEKIKFPSAWTSYVTINQYIDAPMHLLFQGINNSIIEISTLFVSNSFCKRKFIEESNKLLEKVKQMQCHFCRIEPFYESNMKINPGWVAENHLGFSRIIIQTSSVLSYILDPSTTTLKDFKFMIQSWSCLISRLMTQEIISTDEIEDYIRIFLYLFHKFEDNANVTKGNNFMWYNRGNFLSLLNLPDQISNFGSLRHYWEGSRERYIQIIKPFMKNMRQTDSFLATKMVQIYTKNILNNFLDIHEHGIKHTKYDRYKTSFIYSTINEIESHIKDGKVLFMLHIAKNTSDTVYMCTKVDNQEYCVPVIFDDNNGIHIWNQWYSELYIGSDQQMLYKELVTNNSLRIDYCLGIPQSESNQIYRYNVINSNWMSRDQRGKFNLPSLSNEIFIEYNIRF